MKSLRYEIYDLHVQIKANIALKFCLLQAVSPHRINFLVHFLVQYIDIKIIFKVVYLQFLSHPTPSRVFQIALRSGGVI